MNSDNKEVRLDREPDEERKSEFPLGDNTVKTTATPTMTNSPGFNDNENLSRTGSGDVTGSPENDPATKGS
jgi:hypothetical protein